MKTDYAIATTGNGPQRRFKCEIGLFFALQPNGVIVEEFNFGQPSDR
jgi:hypothetical protein